MGSLCLGISVASYGQIDTLAIEHPAEGITYVSLSDSSKPWRIHLLEINPGKSSANIRSHKAVADGDPSTPTRQTLSKMWADLESNGEKPIAGINADFFNMKTGDPINLQISKGLPAYMPHTPPNRSQFGVTAEGSPFIDVLTLSGSIVSDQLYLSLDGVNSLPPADGLTFINRKPDFSTEELDSLLILSLQPVSNKKLHYVFDEQSFPNPPLIVASGTMKNSLLTLRETADTLQTQFRFSDDATPYNQEVHELVGGAAQLLEDGKEVIDRQLEAEGIGQNFASDRHPRTAIGITAKGHIVMMVVDGRQDKSAGMSLYELADFLKTYDVTEAVNLDGGGSTSMIINDEIVNSPSDKSGARTVSNGLFII
ncbi:MAG: phosphodiester glycosidase family protein [Bacteroidota bacterium]